MSGPPRRIGRRPVPSGIMERRIHQNDISTVWTQAGRREHVRARSDIQSDDLRIDAVGGGIGARQRGERRIDFDKGQIDTGNTMRHAQSRRADARTELHNTLAGLNPRRRRQQDRIMSRAMTAPGLTQPQAAAEKQVLCRLFGTILGGIRHCRATRGRVRPR